MHIKVHMHQRAGLPYIYIALYVYVCIYLTPATLTTGIVKLHLHVLHRCGLQVSTIERCCSVRESGNPSDVLTGLPAMDTYTHIRVCLCVYIYTHLLQLLTVGKRHVTLCNTNVCMYTFIPLYKFHSRGRGEGHP